MSSLTEENSLPSNEVRWELFPNKRIPTQSSPSQPQAKGRFLLLLLVTNGKQVLMKIS